MDTRRLWLMWWAGAFGAVALIHFVLAATGVPVTLGSIHIALWVSWAASLLASLISAWCLGSALQQPVTSVISMRAPAEPEPEGPAYHVYPVYHMVGEDDEPEDDGAAHAPEAMAASR